MFDLRVRSSLLARRVLVPLGVATATTAVVAVAAHAPTVKDYSGTVIGLVFMLVTYATVLRHDSATIVRHGLALGGLLEPVPLEARRLARDALYALAWAFGLAALAFPPFWLGWLAWWKPESGFSPAHVSVIAGQVLTQLLAVALPEEAFYRGYLQSALDDAWPPRLKVLGAQLGPSILVTSVLFALGHLLTEYHPNRLGVFFPSLLFGWLRARTGGIGAGVVFHALCNLFAEYIEKSYGF